MELFNISNNNDNNISKSKFAFITKNQHNNGNNNINYINFSTFHSTPNFQNSNLNTNNNNLFNLKSNIDLMDLKPTDSIAEEKLKMITDNIDL